MARHIRSPLEIRSRRLALPVRKKPHAGPRLLDGVSLHYRRNQGNGVWSAKVRGDDGRYWIRAIGQADDFAEADGEQVLTFFQASDRAKELVKPGSKSAPITVAGAFAAYERDLESRGGNVYTNARWPQTHMTPGQLATPVAELTARELRGWRDGFVKKISAASVNRLCGAIAAALEHAARLDPRITNERAWKVGLEGIANVSGTVDAVLSDAEIRVLVQAAYRVDSEFGLFVFAMASTGARAGQLARVTVTDFRDDPTKPILRIPKSGKGGGKARVKRMSETTPVPIAGAFAAELRKAAAGKCGSALLFTRRDGRSWGPKPATTFKDLWRATIEAAGLAPNTTSYALRHSSITRQLLRGIPIRIAASAHDTSTKMIEAVYAKFVSEHSDDIARVAVLDLEV